MTKVQLVRFAYAPWGTFARMPVGGRWLWTVERPWLGNQPFISCIPEGVYVCRPRYFNRGGYQAIEITEVPGRTHILFHKGNKPNDSWGCPLVGEELGAFGEEWGIPPLKSTPGFEYFVGELSEDQFELSVTNCLKVQGI